MPLTFNEYQERARETAFYPDIGNNIGYPALGLCGEAGEVAEKVKKVYRDSGGVLDSTTIAAIRKELGDVLWYLANLAYEIGAPLDTIARENLAKLQDRAARGKMSGSGDQR